MDPRNNYSGEKRTKALGVVKGQIIRLTKEPKREISRLHGNLQKRVILAGKIAKEGDGVGSSDEGQRRWEGAKYVLALAAER